MGRNCRALGVACAFVSLHSELQAAVAPVADIRDIRGAVSIDVLPPFLLAGGVLLVLVALALTMRLRRTVPRLHGAALSPAAERLADAGERLAAMTAEFRQGRCQGDQLILALDELLRAEIAGRSGVSATRLTSAELPATMAPALCESGRTLLADLLPLIDRVKFAGYRPDLNDVTNALAATADLLAALPPRRVVHELP